MYWWVGLKFSPRILHTLPLLLTTTNLSHKLKWGGLINSKDTSLNIAKGFDLGGYTCGQYYGLKYVSYAGIVGVGYHPPAEAVPTMVTMLLILGVYIHSVIEIKTQ